MRHAFATLLLAAVVVLAGCGGSTGTGSPTATATGSPTGSAAPSPTSTGTSTSTPTREPSFDDVAFPDGASAAGIDAPGTLVTRQGELLRNTSFRLKYAFESRSEAGSKGRLVVRYTPEHEWTTLESTGRNDLATWTTDGNVSIRRGEGQQASYARWDHNASIVGDVYRNFGLDVGPELLGRYLEGFQYEATSTFTRNGHTYVEYRTTGVNESFSIGSATYDAGDLTLVLRTDGLVTRLSGSVTIESGDTTRRRSVRYEVTGLGSTTVTAPDWVDGKIPTFEAEIVGGGDVLAITLTEGPGIETGAVQVFAGGRGTANVSGLSPGETVYVTAVPAGETFNVSVHREMPDPPEEAVEFAAQDRVVVSIKGRGISVSLLVKSESRVA